MDWLTGMIGRTHSPLNTIDEYDKLTCFLVGCIIGFNALIVHYSINWILWIWIRFIDWFNRLIGSIYHIIKNYWIAVSSYIYIDRLNWMNWLKIGYWLDSLFNLFDSIVKWIITRFDWSDMIVGFEYVFILLYDVIDWLNLLNIPLIDWLLSNDV